VTAKAAILMSTVGLKEIEPYVVTSPVGRVQQFGVGASFVVGDTFCKRRGTLKRTTEDYRISKVSCETGADLQ